MTASVETTTKQNNNTRTANNPSGIAGSINLSDDVVATIAGMAAQDIDGIHSLGKSRWTPFSGGPTRGVEVEVGSREAAVDVDIVMEYGCDLEAVAKQLRERMASEIKKMARRDVVEININVIDVKLPDEEEAPKPKAQPRVR